MCIPDYQHYAEPELGIWISNEQREPRHTEIEQEINTAEPHFHASLRNLQIKGNKYMNENVIGYIVFTIEEIMNDEYILII